MKYRILFGVLMAFMNVFSYQLGREHGGFILSDAIQSPATHRLRFKPPLRWENGMAMNPFDIERFELEQLRFQKIRNIEPGTELLTDVTVSLPGPGCYRMRTVAKNGITSPPSKVDCSFDAEIGDGDPALARIDQPEFNELPFSPEAACQHLEIDPAGNYSGPELWDRTRAYAKCLGIDVLDWCDLPQADRKMLDQMDGVQREERCRHKDAAL